MRLITCLAIAAFPALLAIMGCTEADFNAPGTSDEYETRRPVTNPDEDDLDVDMDDEDADTTPEGGAVTPPGPITPPAGPTTPPPRQNQPPTTDPEAGDPGETGTPPEGGSANQPG